MSVQADGPGARKGLRAHLPLALLTLALAAVTTGAVLDRAGGPAVPLDDSYIHFQYARSLAELHPFRYTAGAAPTPGATSLLWPLVLAPFYAVGLRAERLVFAAWALGWVSLGLLALETQRLARGLVRPAVALAAGGMALAFGGYTWFAASGMEVVPFAWLITRATRLAADFAENSGLPGPDVHGRRRAVRELVIFAVLCPLMRPEGAAVSVGVAATLALFGRGRERIAFAPSLAGPLVPPLVCLLATGQAVASTALAKWLPLNPYYGAAQLRAAVVGNVGIFFETLLDGKAWTLVFLPGGGNWVGAVALPALLLQGRRQGRLPRALLVTALALTILVPTTYETFLVNRVRYIWPFATAWFVGLAALAELTGDAVEGALARWGIPVPHLQVLLAGGVVGLLASRVAPSIDDLAESAHAVTEQQVSLARWSRDALPAGARVGVNDTGATAYFGGHPTFDIVGLTTRGEARYWTAGPGSRFEHYETLPLAALPTHFVVYPEWFAIDALLGEVLASRSVRHTILGGTTMAAYEARYDALHTGDLPTRTDVTGRRLHDSLDVADLESEAAHGYQLLDATQARNVVVDAGGKLDGARLERRQDHFELALAPGGVFVARLGAPTAGEVRIRAAGRDLAVVLLDAGPWQEVVVPVPADFQGAAVEVVALTSPFDALHYWSYDARRP